MSETAMPGKFSDHETERRRAGSRRLAWLLGAVALALYIIGLFIKR
jgi:hypothetical protein